MKKAVQKSRFRPCIKGIDRMDKKPADRVYSIPKQARYQLRYTRIHYKTPSYYIILGRFRKGFSIVVK